jgi:GT2 family glycosyltransferase
MTPDVSVVVPTYNRADLLGRAVESALAQTAPVREILIVDDGSTDDTARVAAAFPAPVRYIRQANGGVATARNTGIAASAGQWVAFLDSDDEWMPDKVAAQMAALAARPECLWSCTGCELIDGTGRARTGAQSFEGAFPVFRERHIAPADYFGAALTRVAATASVGDIYAGDIYELLFGGNVVLPSSAVVHRSVFDRVGVFDPGFRLAEETEFFHRVASAAPVVIVMAPLVRYRVAQAGSLTASENTPRLVANALRSVDGAAARRQPLPASTRRAWRAGRAQLYARMAYAELSMYHPGAARSAAWAAMREGGGARAAARAGALWLGALLPAPALRGLHAAKRRLKGGA